MARSVYSYVLIVPDAALAAKADCGEENNCCRNNSCSGGKAGAGADTSWAEGGAVTVKSGTDSGASFTSSSNARERGQPGLAKSRSTGAGGGDTAAIRLADAKAALANIATETPQQRQRLNAEHTGGILFWAPPEVQAKKRPNLRRRKARRAQKRTVLDNNFFFLEGPPGEGCIGAT